MYNKIKACIFATTFILVISNSANGQGFYIGPRIGVNYATLSGLERSGADWISPSYRFGSVFGIVTNIAVSKEFSIQPEVIHSQQGVNLEGILNLGGRTHSINQSLRLNYLNFPVLAKLSLGSGNIKGFFIAGPTFGYLLGGSSTDKGVTVSFTSKNLDYLNRFDAGLSFGMGASLGTGPSNFNLDFRFNLGLSDTRKTSGQIPDGYVPVRNGVFSVSLVYLFNPSGKKQ